VYTWTHTQSPQKPEQNHRVLNLDTVDTEQLSVNNAGVFYHN